MVKRLFPSNLPELEWVEFQAEGFSQQVCGVIHSTSRPAVSGMPLGGISTGCVDLETNGTLGYCSIFNSHVPRRGPLNLPFLGFSVGSESWVLTSQKLKGYPLGGPGKRKIRRAQSMRAIQYWGHYPVADLEYVTDAPISVGLRAWAPFIPGDSSVSNTPGAVFEVHLRNVTGLSQKGLMVFSFPGPSPQEVSGIAGFKHEPVEGEFTGVSVTHESGVGYALGVIDEKNVRVGGDLGIDGGAWSRLGLSHWWEVGPLSGMRSDVIKLQSTVGQAGASVAVDFELGSNEVKIIRFILAWYSPSWKGGGTPSAGGNTYTHMYASRYGKAVEAAKFLTHEHRSILKRILTWQQTVYTEKQLPTWLRESLVNILHVYAEDSFWAQAKSPIGEWCRLEDGLFGMIECPRECPQIECIPCSFYGNLPLVYFFPDLALSTLRGYKAYQYPDGAAPWIFGGCTSSPPTPPCEMAMPARGIGEKPQATLDGPCYVDMVNRLWMRTGNAEVLREFYPSVKKNTVFTMNMRPEDGPRGIISMPSGNNGQDWIENCDLYGMVSHIGGVHLANLRMVMRMAEEMGDKEFAQQCRNWFEQGSRAMEEYMWTGGYYLLYYELETGKRSDVIMSCQLDGEWMAEYHGLEGVFHPERVKTTLETLKQTVTDRGAVVFSGAKEKGFQPGYWTYAGVHPPSSFMLAMTYMYNGERDFGLELARRAMRTVVCENPYSWDIPILFDGDTGEIIWGSDYYQNLMLWALPAALEGQDLAGPCKPGGLVYRIIEADKEDHP